ncbi:CotH kinase family protein [Flammeovirga pacifica]|uniref:Spore coat protein n=1 Tax=Flammeovirga pacifica TaxID=915059 RepID=A0A1S1Z074_FLAPC|nr:CotH kinase family protein [Flammeovirga pacifica]OHX66651.1 spore coat protein [Flammeovirga pacifica]
MNLKIQTSLSLVLSLFLVFGCTSTDVDSIVNDSNLVEEDSTFIPTDWTDATHSKSADPNFDVVFEENTVKRLDFVVTPSRWQSMLDNMTELYGTFGVGNQRPGGGFSDEDPIFVPAEVFFEDKEWYKVGIRFKGNSSLMTTWQNGNLKLSFKLDFDEYEDDYPQIDNQRFYGFKKLSLKNNYDDQSFVREKVAGDLFRKAGLAGSHTAFYTLYVDYGDGPVYFGLYTLVEEVDDTVIDTQFSDDGGNLYKPDGDAASFALGSYDETELIKKTNEDDLDWNDVQNLYTILHDDRRISDAEAWRSDLEEIFDVPVFLKYLAVNTLIQNWDTYGRMTHNYLIYNNPENDKLTWIPWDNNEALQDGKQSGALALDFSDLNTSEWPLIGYLYADDTYKEQYDMYLKEVNDGVFNANTMHVIYNNYATLLTPYATVENPGYTFLNSSSDFLNGIEELKSHVESRNTAAENYLK